MTINSIYDFFKNLNNDDLSFLYHGFFHDEFTEKIIDVFEKNIDKSDEPNMVRNKVSFLIAEAFQNIVRHGKNLETSKNTSDKTEIFTIRNINNVYYIASANLVDNKNIDKLTSKLAKINKMDKDKLKEVYLDIINNQEFSEKGGAGVGLIQIASKSGNPIEFDFEKIDENLSFFYMQIKLKSKKTSENQIDELLLQKVQEIHNLMAQNNTHLAYKGDFSQENVLTLLKIIERNFQVTTFKHEGIKTLIYITLTELLQNISKHAFSKNNIKHGIFVIGKYLDKYYLSTGNFIDNKKTDEMKKSIDLINSTDKASLQKLYIERIRNGIIDNEGNAGVGLIEIAKESSDKIEYDIITADNEISFLTITILI